MGQDAEEKLLAAMQGDRRALLDHAEAVEQVGTSMQRISRRIRRKLVQGSTEMWTGPGADQARAAFSSLADETETRGQTYEQAAAPMREAARAIKQSREDYETLPNPWSVRANAGLIGDGGFQDADQMNAWVAEQRAALAEKRQQESAQHYRSYSTSMAAAADDLESTLPRRSGQAPPVDTSVTTYAPGGYSAPADNGWSPGGVGGGGGGAGGGGFVRAPDRGGAVFGGLHGEQTGVIGSPEPQHPGPDLPPTPTDPTPTAPWPDATPGAHPGGSHSSSDQDGRPGPGQDGGSGGSGGLSAGLGIGAGVAAVGAVGLGIGLSRGRPAAGSPGGLLASAAGARGDGRGAGGRAGSGGRGAVPVVGATGGAGSGSGGSGGRGGGRGGMVPVTGMAGAAPNRGSGQGARGAGARGAGGARGGVPVTGAAGRGEREGASADQHWAVEDDWLGEDEAGPPVLR